MTPDAWTALRRHTMARIALGSSGDSLPTAELLRFGVAHAQARDAVHLPLDAAALVDALAGHGFETIELDSAADDRPTYIRRPDLGRQLSEAGRERLAAIDAAPCDVLFVVADGLSAVAAQRHAVPLLLALQPRLASAGVQAGPIVVARQARVALGDPIGEALRARLVVVLIGERPGLSSPDSLGAYLTWAPRPGRADSERNCVSNIRPEGLDIDAAAHKLAWLIGEALQRSTSGIALKDGSDAVALPDAPAARIAPAG